MRDSSTFLVLAMIAFQFAAVAQAPSGQGASGPAPQSLPAPIQFKKTVIFITTNCVHAPSQDELAAMSPQARARWTEEAIAKLTPEELAGLRQDSYFGTGFIVSFLDDRLGKGLGFTYVVTNRHVAQPGIENGKPCKVVNYSFSLNHRGTVTNPTPFLQSLVAGPANLWTFPDDDSVDLAATELALSNDENGFDFMAIPTSLFVTQEMIQKNEVVEGDPVIFAGLFVQYAGTTRLDPVVRSGAIAMFPEDVIQTTLHKLGHIYLAEAHAFGGNSGSPMFVDIDRFRNSFGYDYRFLGVVTGEIQESADLTLQVATTYKGTISANSNVSVIVPAYEVRNLLMLPLFQQHRNAYFASHPGPLPANPQPAGPPQAK